MEKNIKIARLVLLGLVFSSLVFYISIKNAAGTAENVFLDSDQDGLTDSEEKLYGTNPNVADTDSDGYSDGVEVKSGYDPKKPAPDDRVTMGTGMAQEGQNNTGNASDESSLTDQMAQKIAEISTSSDGEDSEVTLDDIKSMVDESLNTALPEEALPEVTEKDIRIKKQSWKGMSDTEVLQKKKNDLIAYISAIYYILSSNSPHPITSATNVSGVLSAIATDITASINSGDSSSLTNLVSNSQKVVEQIRGVEVPEELAELHVKALRYALYAQSLQDNFDRSDNDPLKDIAKLSKIQAFMGSLLDFSTEVEAKMNEYGVSYEEMVKGELEKMGIELPTEITTDGSEN